MKYYEDEEYREMCEKAVEIQEGWKPKEGDWFYSKEWGKVYIWSRCTSFYKHYVWLPNQEDLQEMVGKEEIHIKYEPGNRYNPLYPWGLWTWSEGEDKMGTYRVLVKSPYAHQLWLTIVMRKLYKKKEWDPMKKLWEKEC